MSGKTLVMKEIDEEGKVSDSRFDRNRKAASSVKIRSMGRRFERTSRASFGADLNALVRRREI
jgi:hypothetical protein